MQAKDFYKILGVSENASPQEIKTAYRKLAKQYHPDANPGNKEAEEKFKAISEAYDTLGDRDKKAKYDQMRKYGFGSGGMNSGGFDFGSYARSGRSNGPGAFTFESLDLGDLGSIFNQFFGGAGPFQQAQSKPRRGQDIQVTAEVPFETAASGGQISLTIQKEDICPACEGGGARPGSTIRPCSRCHGRGTISGGQSMFGVSGQTCPACGGRGQVIENPCTRCKGKGVAPVRKTYSVRIAPGTRDGEQIRLKGQGQKDPSGLPPGNLYVTVRVKSHRFFKQQGNNILCTVQISEKQAEEGTTLKINTVHGSKVHLKIPAGSQTGTTLRIPQMGIGSPENRGDQLVRIEIKKKQKKAV